MLSKDEILNIATLARIGLSEKEIEKYKAKHKRNLKPLPKKKHAEKSITELN